MRMTMPIEVEIPAPNIHIALPADAPLMCSDTEAARLFGISKRQLYQLKRRYKDFPVRKIGASVRYLVPDLYAWFRDFGGDIDTD